MNPTLSRDPMDSPLIDCQGLSKRLNEKDEKDEKNVVILDATFFLPNQNRNARQEFLSYHIPGAQFFDVETVADPETDLPHMLPASEDFAAAAGAFGIDNDTLVVTYDNNGFMASARAWWMFRVFGHERVRVLDGGLGAWSAAGLPTEDRLRPRPERAFSARFRPELVCHVEQVQQFSQQKSRQIVDARSPDRFSGHTPEPRPGLRSGHIPGSANVHYAALVDPQSKRLKPVPELEASFLAAGVDAKKPIVTSCGSGVTAAILALALSRLGRADIPVYDGSWAEWGRRQDLPVETG